MSRNTLLRNNPLHSEDLDALHGLDWDDLSQVQKVTHPILINLARNPKKLVDAMQYVAADSGLMSRNETDHFFHRIILYEDVEAEFSVRLQFVKPSSYDRPHCHRSTFAAMVLNGSYTQSVFSLPYEIEMSDPSDFLTKEVIRALTPVTIRKEQVGDTYVIHHSCFHSTQVGEKHVSVVVRGPAKKDCALFIDQRDGSYDWVKAGKLETPEKLNALKMSHETMLGLIGLVKFLDATKMRALTRRSSEVLT